MNNKSPSNWIVQRRALLVTSRFILSSAIQNLRRNLTISIAGILTMSLILTMVGATLLSTNVLSGVLNSEQSKASNLRIYLNDNTSLAQVVQFSSELQSDPRVTNVTYETQEEAAVEAAKRSSTFVQSLGILGANPLPASLNLNFKNVADVQSFDKLARSSPLVQTGQFATSYNATIIPRLQALIHGIELAAIIVTIVLGFISVVVVMNSIRTAVYSRRREIEIMKLVGATNRLVRLPFLAEGMIGGVLAAFLAILILNFGYEGVVQRIHDRVPFLPVAYDHTYLVALLSILLLIGIALGGFGSYVGIRRFLRT